MSVNIQNLPPADSTWLSSITIGLLASIAAAIVWEAFRTWRLSHQTDRLCSDWTYWVRPPNANPGRTFQTDPYHISMTISRKRIEKLRWWEHPTWFFYPNQLWVERVHRSEPEGSRTWEGELVVDPTATNRGVLNWHYRDMPVGQAEFGAYSVAFVPPNDMFLTPIEPGDKDITWLRRKDRYG